MTHRARLVLWDIDRTLMYTGVGVESYAMAFRAVTGRALEHVEEMAGRTERDIASATFARHGIEPSEACLEAFFVALTDAFHTLRAQIPLRGRCLAGSREALASFATVPGLVQSVVTGNIRPVAVQKLTAFQLDLHIDFDVGGYGTEDGIRSTLVRSATERARRRYGADYRPGDVVVIGDTPHDVVGALDAGAVPIGVATGRSSVADLHAAGARRVLPDLTDLATLTSMVLGGHD